MARLRSALRQIYLMLAVASFTTNSIIASRVYCPPNLKVEQGANKTISCSHNGSTLTSSYWYKEDPSLAGPILWMEDGTPGGEEYGKGHYNITNTGAMVIQNSVKEDESIYWFLAYFDDGDFEKHNFTINVTITPSRPCPVIDVCSSCEVCSMIVNRTGSFKCSITESRPKITLNWVVKNAKEIEFFKPILTAKQDFTTATWNTTIEIPFVARSCNQRAVLQCVAQDNLNILQHWNSSVEIYTGNCSLETLDINTSLSRVKIIIIFVASSVSLMAVLVIVFVLYIKSKPNTLGYKRGETASNKFSMEVQSPVKQKMPKKVLGMVSQLKDCYRSYCFYKVLGQDNPTPVDRLYTDCQCTVSLPDGDTFSCNSSELLINARIRSERKVFVSGDVGCGKTMFLLQLVKQWVDEEDPDYILIFASVSGTAKDMAITDIIGTSSKGEFALDIQDIGEAIRTCKCLIILDGLEEIVLDTEENAGNSDSTSILDQLKRDDTTATSHKLLTVQEILSAKNNTDFSNMSVWIAIRDDDHDHQRTGNSCMIRLNEFSDEQIQSYIKITYSNYVQSGKEIPGPSDAKDENSGDEEAESEELTKEMSPSEEEEKCLMLQGSQDNKTETGSNYHDNVCKNVYKFLEQYDIIKDFRKIARFLVTIVHVTLTKFVLVFPYKEDVTTWDRAELMDDVVECLISTWSEVKNFPTDITCLRRSLEDKSWQLIFENMGHKIPQSSFVIDDKQIECGLKIGFLRQKPSDQCSHTLPDDGKGSSGTEITFRQLSFQDYFAARSITKNHDNLLQFNEMVLKCKKENISGFIKFIGISERSSLKEVCDVFMKIKWYNNAIDCLYEGLQQEEEPKILEKFRRKNITFFYLESNYHRNALKSFCKKCKEQNVKLASMNFVGAFPISSLEDLTLYSCKRLNFVQNNVKKGDFGFLLRKLTKENGAKQLRFLKCTVEDVSSEGEDIKHLEEGLRPEVYRQFSNDGVLQKFNYETLKWEIGKVGTLINAIVKED